MTRTLRYEDGSEVAKGSPDSIRTISFDWHDPSSDNYVMMWREEPVIDADGNPVTDPEGNPLYNAFVAAEMRNVADSNISTEVQNFVDAINAAFPAEWPTAMSEDIEVNQ